MKRDLILKEVNEVIVEDDNDNDNDNDNSGDNNNTKAKAKSNPSYNSSPAKFTKRGYSKRPHLLSCHAKVNGNEI
ncbi:hypothetical protein [Nibrella viscosa]